MEEQSYMLSDKLPLATPYKLMVDPTNLCNFKCTFCPTGDVELLKKVNRPAGMMKIELFKKIIDDLKEFPENLGSLRLFKDGESFLNKDLFNMIAYAKESGRVNEVYIISNGALIDEAKSNKILDSGLDRLRISVEHVSDEKYREITKTFSNYSKIIDNISYLYNEKLRRNSKLHVDIKIIDTGLTVEEKEKFKNDFQGISDQLTIETLMGWNSPEDKDFTLNSNPETGIDGKSKIKNRLVCAEPFEGLAINFNGSASVCCVDWAHETSVGNVVNESLFNIWNGQRLRDFRLMHLEGKRSELSACASCHYLEGHRRERDLDATRKELIPKYLKEKSHFETVSHASFQV